MKALVAKVCAPCSCCGYEMPSCAWKRHCSSCSVVQSISIITAVIKASEQWLEGRTPWDWGKDTKSSVYILKVGATGWQFDATGLEIKLYSTLVIKLMVIIKSKVSCFSTETFNYAT